jgi:predicted RNA-binding protein with PIN domain
MAADALGKMPAEHLPAGLRRVAGFAPARRVRLAANPLASALENDALFRERVATQVRLDHAELAGALESGTPPMAADPVELAALAYLLRPEGWVGLLETLDARRPAQLGGAARAEASTAAQLRAQVAKAKADARAARQRERERTLSLQADNDGLRSRLAELGRQLSAARALATKAATELAAERSRLEASAASLEQETRRLRVRTGELEAELSAARRGARESRSTGTMRARLLLDTLLDTAQGLRRELALPPVTFAPADGVAAVVPPSSGSVVAAGPALGARDPALVAELFALPRVHVIVDGYNVTKTAWPDATLQTQRERLVGGLRAMVARTGAEVTVVFDGADLELPPPTSGPRGVRVLFSRSGTSADEVIRELVEVEPRGRPLVVVSSDKEVADGVQAEGARPVAADALVALLSRGSGG